MNLDSSLAAGSLFAANGIEFVCRLPRVLNNTSEMAERESREKEGPEPGGASGPLWPLRRASSFAFPTNRPLLFSPPPQPHHTLAVALRAARGPIPGRAAAVPDERRGLPKCLG